MMPVLPGTWTAMGPAPIQGGQTNSIGNQGVSGAIKAVAVHPSNPAIIYVATVNGGIWKTISGTAAVTNTVNNTQNGPSWTALTDSQVSLSMGALKFDPTDVANNTLVAGFGRFSSDLSIGGSRAGILRTSDGGTTWANLNGGGTLTGENISGIAPRGAIIVAGVDTNDANTCSGLGIERSTDTGATFTAISGTGNLPLGQSFDVAGDPSNSAILYTGIVIPNGCSNGTSGIYKSTDTGATWALVSNSTMNTLISPADNIKISVGNSNNVYVAIEQGALAGLFRSSDGGGTFTQLDTPSIMEAQCGKSFGINPGSQGNLHISLVADPNNANVVYVAGDRQPANNEGCPSGAQFPNAIGASNFTGRVFRVDASKTAGTQFAHETDSNAKGPAGGGTANSTSPHADSRGMVFDSSGNLLEVGDGGIFKRTSPQDNTGDWFSLVGNLQVSEFHDAIYDRNSKIIFGGSQDNGAAAQIATGGVVWNEPTFLNGDGGNNGVDLLSSPGNSIRYQSSSNFAAFSARIFNSSNQFQSETFPALTVTGGGAAFQPQFYTPIRINAINPMRIVIAGANDIYESSDGGNTITQLTPAVVVNDGFSHIAIAYGGRADGTNNPDLLYAAQNAQIFLRTAPPPAPLAAVTSPGAANIVGIVVDPNDYTSVYAIDASHVFHSTASGSSWTDITGNLPVSNATIDSIEFMTNSIVVGTNRGVYQAMTSALTSWSQLGTGLPNNFIFRLNYDSVANVLIAADWGRGIWQFVPPTATPTPTASPTPTPTSAPTGTPTAVATGTPTSSPSATPTVAATATATSVATGTPTAVATGTATAVATGTATAIATGTPTAVATGTATAVATGTATAVATGTPTAVATGTATAIATGTATAVATGTPTAIATATAVATGTSTTAATATPTKVATSTPTTAATATSTLAATSTPTIVPTATATIAPTATIGPTPTATATATPVGPIKFHPTHVGFLGRRANTSSPTAEIKLTNPKNNSGAVTISSISLAGSKAYFIDGRIKKTTCMVGTTLQPGDACKVGVFYNPPFNGPATGQLIITDNASNSPQVILLQAPFSPR
jgi:hypothetical protein